MNATEELRRLLDERGIHWWAGADDRKTLWESNGLTWEYFNDENGDAWLGFLGACEQDITPEQAIAATLGGSCETCPQMDNPDSFIRHLLGDGESNESNYSKLFGTPERAARMIANACTYHGSFDCSYGCLADEWHCGCGDYDALLEWLRGDAE